MESAQGLAVTEITHVIGIDPGVTGAICWTRFNEPAWCFRSPFPLIEEQKENKRLNRKGEKSKSPFRTERYYDLHKLAELLTFPECMRPDIRVFLEKSQAMPNEGGVQSFKYGDCFGQIKGVLAALGLTVEFARPTDWIRVMVPGRKDKKDHVRAAQRLIAEWEVPGWQDAKLSDGEADAILLAEYGRRKLRARG